jgi:hypothetical protein
LLPQLYTDELDVVEEREAASQNRAAIITELGRLRAVAVGDDVAVQAVAEVDEYFPIEDYDELEVSEIIDLLGQLDADELADVRDHEAASQNRRTILQNIDRRLAPAEAAPARRTAPVRRASAPSKKAPAKRAGAPGKKAAPARKAAAPAKKAPAKKAGAPAKKTAPARKAAAPAKKTAPAKKAAAPAKKTAPAKKAAAPAKKAPAKKTAPAKKATKKR